MSIDITQMLKEPSTITSRTPGILKLEKRNFISCPVTKGIQAGKNLVEQRKAMLDGIKLE